MQTSSQVPARFLVDSQKIISYLLNINHRTGGAKAKFFLGWGFTLDHPSALALALIDHARMSPLDSQKQYAYAVHYTYVGPLIAPRGPTPPILTVWKVMPGETDGYLVTAYPV